jgi:hypothetical protein
MLFAFFNKKKSGLASSGFDAIYAQTSKEARAGTTIPMRWPSHLGDLIMILRMAYLMAASGLLAT